MSGVKLHFQQFGSMAAEPLVILHGFFASGRNWRQVASRLSGAYRVIVPDMRNHGDSGHHQRMDYPAMADDLRGLLDELKLDKAHLLGHSMGGKIAMWFALHAPERINKLMVADIAPVSYTHGFTDLIKALKRLPLADLANRKQAEAFLASDIPELSYRQFLLQNLVLDKDSYRWRIDLDIFANTASNIAGFPDVNQVKPYQTRCLVLAGSQSAYVKKQDVVPLFPHAQFAVIDKAGHWLHVEQPDVFIECVTDFLQAD